MSLFNTLPEVKPPFRNNSNQRYTKQLFYEQWNELPNSMRLVRPPFTLNADVEGCLNFGREYVADCDPSGYTTSMRLFKEFTQFEYLLRTPWFKEAKETWDREIEARLYAEGISKLRELAKGEDAKALQAAKVLINPKDYAIDRSKKTVKRGRPSSEEIQGHLKQEAEDAKELEEAMDRIRLVRK